MEIAENCLKSFPNIRPFPTNGGGSNNPNHNTVSFFYSLETIFQRDHDLFWQSVPHTTPQQECVNRTIRNLGRKQDE